MGNIWILGHLVIVGIFIILIHTQEKEEGDEMNLGRKHFWYVNILQFSLEEYSLLTWYFILEVQIYLPLGHLSLSWSGLLGK